MTERCNCPGSTCLRTSANCRRDQAVGDVLYSGLVAGQRARSTKKKKSFETIDCKRSKGRPMQVSESVRKFVRISKPMTVAEFEATQQARLERERKVTRSYYEAVAASPFQLPGV